jgi:outer membrane protein TolC
MFVFCAGALVELLRGQTGAQPPISLRDAVARARQYGGQIQSANLAILQAREDTAQARAARLPSVNAFNQFIYTEGQRNSVGRVCGQ